ncbi:MAG: universal stress protein, partial [Actinomycetota bacterium]|nr:universal stress protein [Actinomycetota bacterium]
MATCLLGRGGELALAHVHPGRTSPRGSLTVALEAAGRTSSLELLESERIAAGIRAKLLTVGSRSVGRGLHELAQRGSCDLLVVGSCTRGFFERATGGDNTRAVLNCSGWAVAVAPAGYAEHPPALREIGVAFDGSPESEQALTLAGSVAADHDARVSAFEALETHPNPFTGGGTSFAEAVDLIISGARRRIEAHPDVEAHVTLGPAVGELSLFSASVDLLVTGSRGHGPLGRLIHASTSKELARSAICPLLVLPHTPFLAVSPETAVGRVDGVDLEGGATVFTIGSEVSCVDGPCGELRRVVIDPVRRELTHLVVEAPHRAGSGHLVPIGLVDATAGAVALRCTRAELAVLEEAQETRFLPGASAKWGYRQNQMLSWPYYGLGLGGPEGLGMAGPQALMFDRVPPGEVEVRRGDSVYATDGPIGRVQGLVIDPADHQVTHVLL